MDKKWIIAPGIVVAGGSLSIWGLPKQAERLVSEHISPAVNSFIEGWVHHPKALFFFIGLFCGVIALPALLRWRKLAADFQKFVERRNASHKDARQIFSRLLDRAYMRWRGSTDAYPKTIDALTDQTKVRDVRRFVSANTDDARISLQEANWALWNFCNDLYTEIIAVQRDSRTPLKLFETAQECVEFSLARKALSEFWDLEAMRIFNGEGLIFKYVWFRFLGPTFQQERLFLQLPFLEVVLARQLNHPNLGARHLFKLSLKAIGKRT